MSSKDFDIKHFSSATQAGNLKRTAHSNAGLDTPGVALSIGAAQPKGSQHRALLVANERRARTPFSDRGPEPRWQGDGVPALVDHSPDATRTGNRGASAVDRTDARRSQVDRPTDKGTGQHLAPMPKRGAVDGRPAGTPENLNGGDSVRDVKLPNPEVTRYRLLYETDDQGQYLSDHKGNPHMRVMPNAARKAKETPPSGAYADTGVEPLKDEAADHLAACAIACQVGAGCDTNLAAREAYLNEALEHLDAACKAHSESKKRTVAQVADVNSRETPTPFFTCACGRRRPNNGTDCDHKD